MTKLKFFISPNFSIPSIWHFLSHTFIFSKPILKAFASAINLCKTCCLFLYKNSLFFIFILYKSLFKNICIKLPITNSILFFIFFNYYFTISRDYSHFSLLSYPRPDQTRPILSPLSPPKPPSQPPLPLFAAAPAASSTTQHKRCRRFSLIARNYDVLSSVLFVFVRFEKQQQALIIRKLQGKPHFAPFLTSLHLLLSDSKLYCHVI